MLAEKGLTGRGFPGKAKFGAHVVGAWWGYVAKNLGSVRPLQSWIFLIPSARFYFSRRSYDFR